MNTVNIPVHQWIIIQHPHLVKTYEIFDKCDAFEPIKIACAVDNDAKKTESTYGKPPRLQHNVVTTLKKMVN